MASVVYSFSDYSVLSPPRCIGLRKLRRPRCTTRCSGSRSKIRCLRGAQRCRWGCLLRSGSRSCSTRKLRGSSIYRTLVFLPALMPVVASAIIWLWMLQRPVRHPESLPRARVSFGAFPSRSPWLAERKLRAAGDRPDEHLERRANGRDPARRHAGRADGSSTKPPTSTARASGRRFATSRLPLDLTGPLLQRDHGIIGALQVFTNPTS